MTFCNISSRNLGSQESVLAAALRTLFSGSALLCLPWSVVAQSSAPVATEKAVEVAQPRHQEKFNTAFLHGAGSYVDLSALLKGGDVAEGSYLVDLYVNGSRSSRAEIVFSSNATTGRVEPCFTRERLQQIGVNLEKIEEGLYEQASASCLPIEQLIHQATAVYDSARLRLNVNVPQAFMRRAKRGYVDPSLWDAGVPVAFANYNFNTSRNSAQHGKGAQNHSSLSLKAGVNAGAWRLRNNSSLTSGTGRSNSFQSQNTYMQRDITSLKSQMWLGDTYTTSQLFDSVRFRGFQMASDEAMLPDDERGYAPVIRGIAESNATIEVRQNGFLIYSANVAPGPFEISDLSPSGSNGNLEVTVIEADGRRHTSIQAFSNPPMMVREGRLKYDLTVGQLRQYQHSGDHPFFVSASALYGLTSNLTVAGGLQSSSGYQVVAGGLGLNTKLGAFSLDIAHSRSRLAPRSESGESVRLMYGKFIESTATNVSLSVHHRLSKGYRSLSEHAAGETAWFRNVSGVRSQMSASLSQRLGSDHRYGSFYLNASEFSYWDDARARSISAGYNKAFGSVGFNVSYSHNRTTASGWGVSPYKDNVLSISVSVPLGSGGRHTPNTYTSLSQREAGTSVRTGVSGTLPVAQGYNYSVSAAHDPQSGNSSSAYFGGNTSVGVLNVGLNHAQSSSSATFQANGSIVLHQGGVNLGPSVGESFVLAQVEPAVAGVGISSYQGASTGRNGFAIVPYATPYRSNWVGLDTEGVSADVEISDNMQQVVPRRGAAVLATFKSETGRRVQFEFKLPDGSPVPFGAQLKNVHGEQIGITDPRGRALVMLDAKQEHSEVTVQWERKQCQLPYSLPEKLQGENYQRVTLTCAKVEAYEPRAKVQRMELAQQVQ